MIHKPKSSPSLLELIVVSTELFCKVVISSFQLHIFKGQAAAYRRATLLLVSVASVVVAQSSMTTRYPSSLHEGFNAVRFGTSAPILLSPTAQSDVEAVGEFRNFVSQTGGARWDSIHYAETVFAGLHKERKEDLVFWDDWSTPQGGHRRGQSNTTSSPQLGDKRAPKTFPLNKSPVRLDKARILVEYLPTASATLLLKNDSYRLKICTGPTPAGVRCVNVYRLLDEKLGYVLEQEWHFSAVTGLPSLIAASSPDMNGSIASGWQVYVHSSFTEQDGLLLPRQLMKMVSSGFAINEKIQKQSLASSSNLDEFLKDTAR